MRVVRWSVALLLVASACRSEDSSPCGSGCYSQKLEGTEMVPARTLKHQVGSAVLPYASGRLELGDSAPGATRFTVELESGYIVLRRGLPAPAAERFLADAGLRDAATAGDARDATDAGDADDGADASTRYGADASNLGPGGDDASAPTNRIVAWITPVPHEGALVDAHIALCDDPGDVLRFRDDRTFEVSPARTPFSTVTWG